jgi:hypothetical protein
MLALAFILICCALAFIASSMYRHQRDPAFQWLQRLGSPSVRRCAGFVWLVFALLLLTTNNTLSHALVEWFGLFSVASVLTMALSRLGRKG